MPFGPNCEYQTFDECVARNRDKDDPDAWCAQLQRQTEGQCDTGQDDAVTHRQIRIPDWVSNRGQSAPEPPRDWYAINSSEGEGESAARIDLYDEIGVSWWGGVAAAEFIDELNALDVDRIDLHINSPGGNVWDGLAIYNNLAAHRARVHVFVDGLAASAASWIAMAGDRVVMGRGTEMMIHDPLALVIGDARDMRAMADDLDRIGDSIAGLYTDRAGGELAEWRERMLAETWYSAAEAVDAGLADELAQKKTGAEDATSHRSSIYAMFRYGGRNQAPAPAAAPAADVDITAVAQALEGAFQ